ncbi:MAG: hypothetical protein IKZ55_04645 [Bacteroidales bacterium]|nr:hypothetical protein [Bacteroidales bacterium]
MRIFRIVMGAMALVVVAATIFACTKDKETNVAQQATETEEVARKPIATYDNATGQMTYHVSVEQLQEALSCTTKDSDRYVLESWCVVDDKTASPHPYLKYVVLDTDNEVSHTTVLLDSFVVKEESNYYLSKEVLDAHYSFTAESADGSTFIIEVDGDEISVAEWDGVSMAPPGGSSCTCTSNSSCKHNGSSDYVCEPVRDGVGWRCHPPCDPHPKAECTKSVSSSAVTPKVLSGLSI